MKKFLFSVLSLLVLASSCLVSTRFAVKTTTAELTTASKRSIKYAAYLIIQQLRKQGIMGNPTAEQIKSATEKVVTNFKAASGK